MNDHQTDKNSHVYEYHNKGGHEIDFENVEILKLETSIKRDIQKPKKNKNFIFKNKQAANL